MPISAYLAVFWCTCLTLVLFGAIYPNTCIGHWSLHKLGYLGAIWCIIGVNACVLVYPYGYRLDIPFACDVISINTIIKL
jgi:hypothetical protein